MNIVRAHLRYTSPGIVLSFACAITGCTTERVPFPGPPAGSSSSTQVASDAAWFEDVTDRLGVDFVHDPGKSDSFFMPECVGSGVALFDLDADGRLDLYLIQNAGDESSAKNRLYRQGEDGKFAEISEGSGLDVAGRGMGVAAGDADNDGLPEIFLTEHGRIRLFHNLGGGKFRDVSESAGITSPLWATSAAFFDYDRDGWLDLVVANYINYDPSRWCAQADGRRDYCGPDAFPGTTTKLFRNLGAASGGPRFEDVSVETGLVSAPGPALGVACLDFDGDRWPDILVANDGAPNHLWVNQRDGTFAEEALRRGIAYNCVGKTEANMGIAIGDVDSDGAFDIYVTHLTEETPTLWRQIDRGLFEDSTSATGLSRPLWRGTGFGTVMADFNADGALDIVAVNGRVTRGGEGRGSIDPDIAKYWRAYAERDQLFVNDGKGKFRDASNANPALSGIARVSRAAAVGDIDGDGALDLVVTHIAGKVRVLKNVAPKRGHWLMVRAIDPALRRDAYGAEITVRTGERTQWRSTQPAYSYLASNDPRVHFGLGDETSVDSIHVVWPDGSAEVFPGGAVDRLVTLKKGEGKAETGGATE